MKRTQALFTSSIFSLPFTLYKNDSQYSRFNVFIEYSLMSTAMRTAIMLSAILNRPCLGYNKVPLQESRDLGL
jgi:hypothetical protein